MPPKKAVAPPGTAATARSTLGTNTPSAEEDDHNEENGAEDTGYLWLPDPGDDADPMTLGQFMEEIKNPRDSYRKLQRLWDIVRTTSTTVTEKDAVITEKDSVIAEKDAQIEELQDLSALATETIAKARTARSSKQTDAPIFTDGTNPTFEGWKIKINNKLRENSDHYPTEKSKVGYIFGRTEGDAAVHLEPGMTNETFLTTDQVFDFLELIYGDPDRELNAREEYRSLIMGKLDFNEFITKFRQLASRANIHESNWKDDLFSKITYKMQHSLMPMRPMIGSFDDLVRQCRLLDIGMRRLNERMNRGGRGNRGDRGRQQRGGSSRLPNSSSTPNRLSTEEHDKYLKEGRCFNCGKTGHMSRECPDKNKESTNITEEIEETEPEQVKR